MTGEAAEHETPFVVLLILTWNRRDDVLRCASSLARLAYPNVLPVVIDNASQDGSVEALQERFPDLTVLRNAANLGYAGGNNVGIRWALERGADYVQIINSDTEVTPEMTGRMVEVAESDPRIAVVGCRNLLMSDRSRLWGAYGVLTYGPFLVRNAGEGEEDGQQWQAVRDVDSVIGNGYLWRAAALREIGLLDETYFGYHEDVDWCLRARRAGHRVVYAGTAAIVHRGGSSSDRRHALAFPASYFLGRNGVIFARRYGSPGERARFALTCSAALAARWARSLALSLLPRDSAAGRRGRELLGMERGFTRGIVDALLHRPIPFQRLGLADARVSGCKSRVSSSAP